MSIKDFARVYRALGQDLRLKIIALLARQSFCVCEMEEIFGVTQPAISQHLRVLKEAGLVEEERLGQWIFYHLNRQRLQRFQRDWQAYLQQPLADQAGLEAELAVVERLRQNPKVCCRPPRRPGLVGQAEAGPPDSDA